MRNSSSLDWLRFMHTPNDYRVSLHFVQTKVFRIFPDNDAALFNIEVDNGIGFIKNDKR